MNPEGVNTQEGHFEDVPGLKITREGGGLNI